MAEKKMGNVNADGRPKPKVSIKREVVEALCGRLREDREVVLGRIPTRDGESRYTSKNYNKYEAESQPRTVNATSILIRKMAEIYCLRLPYFCFLNAESFDQSEWSDKGLGSLLDLAYDGDESKTASDAVAAELSTDSHSERFRQLFASRELTVDSRTDTTSRRTKPWWSMGTVIFGVVSGCVLLYALVWLMSSGSLGLSSPSASVCGVYDERWPTFELNHIDYQKIDGIQWLPPLLRNRLAKQQMAELLGEAAGPILDYLEVYKEVGLDQYPFEVHGLRVEKGQTCFLCPCAASHMRVYLIKDRQLLCEAHNFVKESEVGLPEPAVTITCPETASDYDLLVVFVPLKREIPDIDADASDALIATQLPYQSSFRGQLRFAGE